MKTELSRNNRGEIAWRRNTVIRLDRGEKLHRAAITESNHAMLYCDRGITWHEPGTWQAHDGADPTCNSCVVADGHIAEQGFDPEEVYGEAP